MQQYPQYMKKGEGTLLPRGWWQTAIIIALLGTLAGLESARHTPSSPPPQTRVSEGLTEGLKFQYIPPEEWWDIEICREAAEGTAVPWQILFGIWTCESGRSYDPDLRGPCHERGPLQFLPATFAVYGVDGNGDGVAEIGSVEDGLRSCALLLQEQLEKEGDIERALLYWNHSGAFCRRVKEVARRWGWGLPEGRKIFYLPEGALPPC